MLDLNTFIFVAIAVIFGAIGLVVWVADSGISDKYKTVLSLFVLALMASLIGLFFLVDDNSKFKYAGIEQIDRKGGGGKRQSMMGVVVVMMRLIPGEILGNPKVEVILERFVTFAPRW